ncbi:ribbon-helix-helix domain-containing protein [Jiangella rhizosphaerae]|uniref:CopG family transcriptional regulator n=1 Tax=Jiangella rhizosphaerae TaxID=2293569 RepID=A0A418KIW7_9ACTN|nr:CopG family transcriptional regulator [Jiangella rhizosphaerae]RIQ13243.1 CopG family transcriptional regulator [Jiangella rhizosphaerae]
MAKYIDGGDIDLDEEVVLDSRGNRITEAIAEEMAEHALKRGRGRPALTPGARGHSPEVRARVPEELRDRLVAQASREHRKPSELIRDALERYLQAS